MNKLNLLFVGLVVSILFACGSTEKEAELKVTPVSSGDELLSDDSKDFEMATYPKTAENESVSMQRSFENSPPLIPHTTDGMFKISAAQNQCMMCHMPEKAGEKNATKIPITHFTDYRPEFTVEGGKYIIETTGNEVVAHETGGELNNAMYNCNLCHTPQATIDPMVANLFEADFRSVSSKSRSDLSETIGEGVK